MNKNVSMKRFVKSVCLLIIVCTCRNTVQAQEYLNLQSKRLKLNSSIFSKFEIIDSRYDTAHAGFVQRGLLNRKEEIKFPWKSSREEMIYSIGKMIDSVNKENGTVMINIRKFFISEVTEATREFGKMQLKAGCYLKQDTIYREMFTIDTTYIISGGLDVTTRLLDTVPELWGAFVQRIATFNPYDCDPTKDFTDYDVHHIDELEKKQIPIYNVAFPKKGLYASYDDFKNNHPSQENVIVEFKKGFSRPFIFEVNEKGKKGKEILRKYYYMVSDGERTFISRPQNLYEVTKKEGNFYFTGVGKDAADMGSVVAVSVLFGAIAGGAAANHDTATFEFMLEHNTGRFIPLRKIKD
jgi:hypothetical protein